MYRVQDRSRFQCSSASRKFLNLGDAGAGSGTAAEFQCSSASRKFLNLSGWMCAKKPRPCFSALQRAENSSISIPSVPRWPRRAVSVLFSEPKIPQSKPSRWSTYGSVGFSALQRAENSSILFADEMRVEVGVGFSRHHQDLVIYYFCTI